MLLKSRATTPLLKRLKLGPGTGVANCTSGGVILAQVTASASFAALGTQRIFANAATKAFSVKSKNGVSIAAKSVPFAAKQASGILTVRF